ncbi:MAG: lipoate--protein ligase [Oscillospiraceae bacterium]|nr:lipoate--protein ligase [Oscillospiraceae bacterium]
MLYLETGSTDPAYNLAFEEFVLTHRRKGNYLILWQNRNAVIIGRNQNAAEEINRAFVEEHDIHVVRRNTGGGAVYHDMGNLNYSFITDAGDPGNHAASLFTDPVVRALRGLGLDAEASGRNDILVSGHKVSGTAQQLLKGRILHHGTLLFDSDASMIAGALNPDPTKFQSKSVKSVRSRVGNIRSFLPADMDMAAFWSYLKIALSESGIVPDTLTDEELAQVAALKAAKYDTWEWNFGKSPKFQLCCKRRWPAGLLEIHLSISEGIIKELQILGDFLALTDLAPLTQALTGCAYRKDAIGAVLDQFSLNECLGGITKEEFLNTILNKG